MSSISLIYHSFPPFSFTFFLSLLFIIHCFLFLIFSYLPSQLSIIPRFPTSAPFLFSFTFFWSTSLFTVFIIHRFLILLHLPSPLSPLFHSFCFCVLPCFSPVHPPIYSVSRLPYLISRLFYLFPISYSSCYLFQGDDWSFQSSWTGLPGTVFSMYSWEAFNWFSSLPFNHERRFGVLIRGGKWQCKVRGKSTRVSYASCFTPSLWERPSTPGSVFSRDLQGVRREERGA